MYILAVETASQGTSTVPIVSAHFRPLLSSVVRISYYLAFHATTLCFFQVRATLFLSVRMSQSVNTKRIEIASGIKPIVGLSYTVADVNCGISE